jgi:hypothetical protein
MNEWIKKIVAYTQWNNIISLKNECTPSICGNKDWMTLEGTMLSNSKR